MPRHKLLTVKTSVPLTDHQLVEKKKNWPKEWGGHGHPGHRGSIALDALILSLTSSVNAGCDGCDGYMVVK